MKLWLDTETYSEIPITNGTHAYAEKAEVLLLTWAVDDGPIRCEDMSDDWYACKDFWSAVDSADEYWWHNGGMFDRVVLKHALPHARMPEHKWRDTMVQALAHGLPGSLGALSEIFKLGDNSKDKRGKQLIRMFCMLQPKNSTLRRKT